MNFYLRAAIVGLATVGLAGAAEAASPAAHPEKPYRLEAIPNSPVKRVVLTSKAAERLDIQTGVMRTSESGGLVAPYQALFYDLKGDPWVYTMPAPLSYVRHKVVVGAVDGPHVLLVDGPTDGTAVVIVGVAQLYGTERGVGH